LISRRVYKPAMSHREALGIIVEGRGTHFDPVVVDAFIRIQDEFQDIARRFADDDETLQRKQDWIDTANAPLPEA